MNKHRRRRGAGVAFASLCLSSILAGCASFPVPSGNGAGAESASEWIVNGNRVTYLSQAHSSQVSDALPGEMLSLGASPWGDDTVLTLHRQYFSAAGNRCYAASVLVSSQRTHAVNLCDYGQGIWGATRAIVVSRPVKQGVLSFGGLE